MINSTEMFTTGFAMEAANSLYLEVDVVEWMHAWLRNPVRRLPAALQTEHGAANRFLLVELDGNGAIIMINGTCSVRR